MQHMPDTVLPMEITPQELAQRARAGEKLFFIDVRELIPMGTISANLQHIEQLSDERTIIVFCHHGVRSLHVVNWLRNQGVMACQSMAGGIDRWSCEIDPGIPRYYS
jgi:rhodanese-related sulfurtransferase